MKVILVYIRLCLVGCAHVVFISIVLSRVLGAFKWPWAAVFSPLFLFDLISLVYLIIYICGLISNKLRQYSTPHNTICFPHQRASVGPPIFYSTGLVFKILAEILLVLYLDTGTPPFYVSSIFFMCLFLTLTVGHLTYSLKPNIKEIYDKR